VRAQSKFLIVLCVMLVMPVLLWWDQQSGAIKNEYPGGLNDKLIKGGAMSGAVSAAAAGLDDTAETVPSSETPPAENEASASAVPAEDSKPESVSDAADVAAAGTQSVELTVRGLKPAESRLQVAVFEGAQGFPDADAAAERTTVDAGSETAQLTLTLKSGVVAAIAVFQDLDGNGVLTKNGLGIPTEPYGFSNNARGTFGPPRFDKAQLTVAEELKTLEIRVR
jgi:uncharacterized protein (DUF2141 family)